MAAIVTGGIASIKFNGAQAYLRGSLKIKPGSTKNTPIVNQDGTVVFTQMAVTPMMTMNLSDYGNFSVQALEAISGATITATLTNGKSYVLTNGTYVDESELNTEDGSVSFSFAGSSCTELLAGGQ